METSTTPGWYPDPAGRYEFRYHNGVRWTADVSANGQRYVEPAAPPGPSAPAPTATPPKGKSGMAITTFVLGISSVSLAWLPFVFVVAAVAAVVGLVFGIVTLRRRKPGRTMAMWGTVLSILALPLCMVGYAFTHTVIDKLEDPGAHLTHITRCELDGRLLAEGTIDNLTDVNRYYEVTVVWRADDVVLGRTTVLVDDVGANTSAPFVATAAAPSGATSDVQCTVESVKNNLP